MFKETGYSDDRAKELAYHLLSHYCIESNGGNTKDGEPRKWLKRGTDYRANQLHFASLQFDRDEFRRFCSKSTKATTRHKRRNNEYSEPTKGLALFVVDLLSGVYEDWSIQEIHDHVLPEYGYSLTDEELTALVASFSRDHMYNDTPGPSSNEDIGGEALYPTKSDITGICERVDRVYKGNSKTTFDSCLKRLQRSGSIKVAELKDGEDYRIYPADFEDPTDSNWIRYRGEKYRPGEEI